MSDLDKLYESIYGLNMEGGWHRKAPALWAEPRENFLPYTWRLQDVRPILEHAGELVDHTLADRRNLTLTNPVEGNPYATLRTMVAAYQSLLPGEAADSHRHTPNALRIILEGQGSYTVVDGTRVEMRPGDVLLTPSWAWHSHDNVGQEKCLWVDVLDVPFVHLLEPMFFERHPDKFEKEVVSAETSPLAWRWEDSLRRLNEVTPDPLASVEKEIELGSPALSSMAVHVQEMRAGFTGASTRVMANAIYTVMDGKGKTTVGETTLNWQRGDVFVIPAWRAFQHEVEESAHLIRVSDEPIMRAFDFLRVQREAI